MQKKIDSGEIKITAPGEKALRFNTGKPQWDLVHYKSLEPMIRVLEFGAMKYARDNWQKPMPLKEILSCMQRHLGQLMDAKNDLDQFDFDINCNECQQGTCMKHSAFHHIGHILCNAMFYAFQNPLSHENKRPKNNGSDVK